MHLSEQINEHYDNFETHLGSTKVKENPLKLQITLLQVFITAAIYNHDQKRLLFILKQFSIK